jgi:hypothetical protein
LRNVRWAAAIEPRRRIEASLTIAVTPQSKLLNRRACEAVTTTSHCDVGRCFKATLRDNRHAFPIARPIDESARHSLSAVKRGHVNDAHGCCMTYIRFIILTAIMRDDFVATA